MLPAWIPRKSQAWPSIVEAGALKWNLQGLGSSDRGAHSGPLKPCAGLAGTCAQVFFYGDFQEDC